MSKTEKKNSKISFYPINTWDALADTDTMWSEIEKKTRENQREKNKRSGWMENSKSNLVSSWWSDKVHWLTYPDTTHNKY